MPDYRLSPNHNVRWPALALLLCLTLPALAEEKPVYRDVYLRENRICKACRWELVPGDQVALTNRQGHQTIVDRAEVIGVDQHPRLRRLFMKSLSGIGFPAKIVVPDAFEDGNEFTCKYCDK